MARYQFDPRWITARYSSTCPGCQKTIQKDTKVFYYPKNKEAFCLACGEPMSRDFEAHAFDEAVATGSW